MNRVVEIGMIGSHPLVLNSMDHYSGPQTMTMALIRSLFPIELFVTFYSSSKSRLMEQGIDHAKAIV